MNSCMRRCTGLLVLAGAMAIVGMGFAQPEGQPDAKQLAEMEAWTKAATPGEYHKHLDVFAGEWDCKMKHWMDPAAPPSESTGTMKNTWILGGRHLMQEFKSDFMGMSFEGHGTWGYDNTTKKYVGTWMDTTGTGVMINEGTCDGAGKVFTMIGTFSEPSGQKLTQREVITVKDQNTHTMDFYMTGPDGKEAKSMEIVYTRKAGSAAKPSSTTPKPPQVKPAGK